MLKIRQGFDNGVCGGEQANGEGHAGVLRQLLPGTGVHQDHSAEQGGDATRDVQQGDEEVSYAHRTDTVDEGMCT